MVVLTLCEARKWRYCCRVVSLATAAWSLVGSTAALPLYRLRRDLIVTYLYRSRMCYGVCWVITSVLVFITPVIDIARARSATVSAGSRSGHYRNYSVESLIAKDLSINSSVYNDIRNT